jgi:hypothetical protein
MEAQQEPTCPICLSDFQGPITVPCGHTFCKQCLTDHKKSRNHLCPVCRAKLPSIQSIGSMQPTILLSSSGEEKLEERCLTTKLFLNIRSPNTVTGGTSQALLGMWATLAGGYAGQLRFYLSEAGVLEGEMLYLSNQLCEGGLPVPLFPCSLFPFSPVPLFPCSPLPLTQTGILDKDLTSAKMSQIKTYSMFGTAYLSFVANGCCFQVIFDRLRTNMTGSFFSTTGGPSGFFSAYRIYNF